MTGTKDRHVGIIIRPDTQDLRVFGRPLTMKTPLDSINLITRINLEQFSIRNVFENKPKNGNQNGQERDCKSTPLDNHRDWHLVDGLREPDPLVMRTQYGIVIFDLHSSE